MKPGEMTLPERSFSIALEETKFFPILRITPSLIKTSLFSKVPLSVAAVSYTQLTLPTICSV